MSLLDQVLTGKAVSPRRLMVYGTHGIGKSSFGARAPNPIFIPTEDGLSEIDCKRFPLAGSYDQVIEAISELYTAPHDFETVVLDSLDWLEQLIWNRVCTRKGAKNIEDLGYGKGYVHALDEWRQILEGLSALRAKRGMTTVLIAHAKIERFENPETETYDRYTPRLNRHASALIQEWCDEVFFATYKVFTRSTEEGFGRKRTQGVGTGERVLYTTERPAHVAKNRLNLPDELPLEWDAYAFFHPSDDERN